MIEKVVKRDGRIVPFNREKITLAILSAAVAVGGQDRGLAEKITDDIIAHLETRRFRQSYPTVEEVQDLVEKCLIERGHAKTAKAYIIYRYEHHLKRAGKESLTYSSENIPYRKLWRALSWGVDIGCVTLEQLSGFVEEGRFSELIRESEAFYRRELDDAAAALLGKIQDVRIIIVSGPSSSGKTTTTIKIGDALKSKGYSLVTLNVDNYFYDLKSHPRDTLGDYDYETPQALELSLINRHLRELLKGNTIQIPFYNFQTGNREGISEELKLGAKEIILIDSLHGMFGEMTESIAEEKKFKLYIETLSQLKDETGRFIRWADIRMLRRMIRDKQFRNHNPGETLNHWHYVRRSELRYIVSRLREAHVVVNSFLPYELPVMKARLGDLFPGFLEDLKGDPEREDAFERAQRVSDLFRQIPAWTDDSVIPQYSLLREFIGGSGYTY
jgi:uridine kinase